MVGITVEPDAPLSGQARTKSGGFVRSIARTSSIQIANGLKLTATLDQQTADALTGGTGIGQGSSVPSKVPGARPMSNSSGASDFGDRNVPK
jgi:hypothetical protein